MEAESISILLLAWVASKQPLALSMVSGPLRTELACFAVLEFAWRVLPSRWLSSMMPCVQRLCDKGPF